MKYQAIHTLDELGGRYPSHIVDVETDSVTEAIAAANIRTNAGQCGAVLRTSDGATLAPDGTWTGPGSPAVYAIETLRDGAWTADGLGEDNEFETEEHARIAIPILRRLGADWASAEYRVVLA